MDNQLSYVMETARRTGAPLTVAMADLDHFKIYNDRFGHQAGDVLLRSFGHQGRAVLRAVDVLSRWGGEEFAIALTDCAEARAASILHRVRSAVPDGQTCSIGYATWDTVETAHELMHRVDRALYAAKRAGRDCIHDAAMVQPPH
jgi:diguanylate cyclase (GGDEF)-like protein